ncbi:MAG: hypothetical protein DRO23_08580 [Thermoprotei archaeon]|nr:MAG: hypothetical protein DRO23_08580 [Thermoprotei archaeon]
MKEDYKEIVNKLEEHIELEEKSIREYSKVLSKIESKVLKEFLRGILIDSIAHRELLKAIINVLNKVSKEKFVIEAEKIPMKREDIAEIVKTLKEHIKTEERTVRDLLSIAEKVEIYPLRETLRTLFEDEVRHHTVLKNIIRVFEEYSERA